MEPSSTAVAGDFPPMTPALQQQEDDFIRQHPIPPSPARPPRGSPILPSSVSSDEEEEMDVAEDFLRAKLSGGDDTSDSSDDNELRQFDPPRHFDKRYYKRVNKLILEEDTEELVWLAKNRRGTVNLMNDPLLSVVIASKKTQIALELIKRLPDDTLEAKNFIGDTALHVAATVGHREVADALLNRSLDLAEIQNNKGETPLHKAAFYGQEEVFQLLVEKAKNSPDDRTNDGATVLHCAVMGNAPGLALKIAMKWQDLAICRNLKAVTPLQLMVTIPEAFRSQLVFGSLDNLLYNWIPLKEPPKGARKQGIRDIEDQDFHGENSQELEKEEEEEEDEERGRWIHMLFYMILRPIYIFIFELLRQVSPRISRLYKLKEAHSDAMKLIECLAKHPRYFDFFFKGDRRDNLVPASLRQARYGNRDGKKGPESKQRDLLLAFVDHLLHLDDGTNGSGSQAVKGLLQSANRALESMSSVRNWSEPPLIIGAEMGLHEFVGKILQVCPESATYLDSRGRNVLQAAIESGSREIVEIIRRKTAGYNPVLPSWLLWRTKRRRTILHFASERASPDTDDAVQLQDELLFFEAVKGMVPKELVYSRNKKEMTAQEVFSESHKEMLKSCKNQLTEMGKTCAGLVAAVVFASSFSIPGEKDEKTGNPVYMDRLSFKIFSHTYVIGLSCAATSLVLFLSLVISPYKEQQFRKAIPTKYFLACLSFAIALLALLVSFTCNIFLQIYGGQKTESDDLIPLILELTVFPALCFIVLYYRGATFWPTFRRIWK